MKCLLYENSTKTLKEGAEELIDGWKKDSDSTIWVQITGDLDKPLQEPLRLLHPARDHGDHRDHPAAVVSEKEVALIAS